LPQEEQPLPIYDALTPNVSELFCFATGGSNLFSNPEYGLQITNTKEAATKAASFVVSELS
jgi:hypothetical protein